MTISTLNFASLVANQAAAIQADATALVDFSEGSILLAAIESNAAQGLFLQSLVLQLLAVTRAATSNGADLDSFVNDFGLTRIAARPATYVETFARFTDTAAASIPVGITQVQTANGAQTYTVIADPTNITGSVSPAGYSASTGAYYLPAGVASLPVLVQAVSGGAATNTIAGNISVLLDAVSGVDTVTNASATPVVAGQDAETDAALRIRFQEFIASLASGTPTAIETAAQSVQAGLFVSLTENVDPSGAADNGYVYVVVDDGSGDPPSSLINAVAAAIDNDARAAGIRVGVFGPTLVTVTIAMTVTVLAGYDQTTVATAVQAAVTAYVASLELGAGLIWSRLYQVAYDSTAGIAEVSGLTINGGVADIAGGAGTVIRAPAGHVTVS